MPRNFATDIQSFQRFWGMGELSIHRWKGFELYPVINKKTVSYGYRVNIGEYLGRGWDLLQPKLGIFAGYVLVLFGIGLALSFVPFVVSLIVNTIISPPLYARTIHRCS